MGAKLLKKVKIIVECFALVCKYCVRYLRYVFFMLHGDITVLQCFSKPRALCVTVNIYFKLKAKKKPSTNVNHTVALGLRGLF